MLVSFNCGHGIMPEMAKRLDKERFRCLYVINETQSTEPFPKKDVKKIKTVVDGYPDTDTRRRYALEYASMHKYQYLVIMDDNIVMDVEELWYMIQNTEDRMVSGSVRANSNRHSGYERHGNYPTALYPERDTNTHVYEERVTQTILREPHESPIVPLGVSSIYKLQIFSGVPTHIDTFRKLLPHGGFEPWQDMWLLVWAYYIRVPVRIFYNKCYQRVTYKTEKKEHRVRGRCRQTLSQYLFRIKPKTIGWPLEMLHFGLTFVQHRGTEYYLEWDYGDKEMFNMSNVAETVLNIPPCSVPWVVFEWWDRRYKSNELPYSLHEYRIDKVLRDAWKAGTIPKGHVPDNTTINHFHNSVVQKLQKMNELTLSEKDWEILDGALN